MIRLICILEQEDGHEFKIVVGQEYDPLGCKEINGEWHYLIEKVPPFFGYWYPEHMFQSVHYSGEELDKYVKELIEAVENDFIKH